MTNDDQQLPAAQQPPDGALVNTQDEGLVTSDLVSGMGYDQETTFDTVRGIELRMDHDGGKLLYGGREGEPIGSETWVSIVQRQQYRRLWERDYEDVGKDEENHMVCFSPDGDRAMGLGRRPMDGESDWKDKIREQNCLACPTAKWKRTPKGPKVDCAPRVALFLFVYVQGKWVPAIYHAHGLSYKPADLAYTQSFRAMELTRRKLADGRVTFDLPIFWIPWKIAMVRSRDLDTTRRPAPTGYTLTWTRAPKTFPSEGAAATETMDFVQRQGKGIVSALAESLRSSADRVGELIPETDDHGI